MNTWLVGFNTEISDVETATYMLIQADCLTMAEAAVTYIGQTWWSELREDDEGYWWLYSRGVVCLNNILLLQDVENSVLRNLKFLDVWIVSGTPESPIIRDEYGENWLDFTR